MTSKNSFWVDLKENNRRRIWLWVISWLFFLFYFIVGCALLISGTENNLTVLGQRQLLTELDKKIEISLVLTQDLYAPISLFLPAVILSVLSAVQGFSYLYHRKRVDMYHSLPVKKSRRFAVIWLNGLMIYLLPSLVGFFGGLLVAAGHGVAGGEMVRQAGQLYLMMLLLYLALYHLNIAAVMLTGNIMVTLFGIGVLQFYEPAIRLLAEIYKSVFFDKYYGMSGREIFNTMWFSPYHIMFALDGTGNKTPPPVFGTVWLTAQLLLLGLAALWLYRKRPAEAAGKALAFAGTRPVIKMAIVVPAVLAAALAIKELTASGSIYSMVQMYNYDYYNMINSGMRSAGVLNSPIGSSIAVNGSPWFIALAMIVTAALAGGLLEVIFEFDIKACLSRKKHILIGLGLAAVIYLGFNYDWTGYDAYIPQPAQLSSYAFVLEGEQNYYAGSDISGRSDDNYVRENMFMTDRETICRLAAIQPGPEDCDKIMSVNYRLKMGSDKRRTLWLDYDNQETIELLDRLVGSPEYKAGALMVMADDYAQYWQPGQDRTVSFYYQKGPYIYALPEELMAKLLEAYRSDLEFINFTDISRPGGGMGTIILEQKSEDNVLHYQVIRDNLPLYAECIRTVTLLREAGVYMEEPFRTEDIARIDIYYTETPPPEYSGASVDFMENLKNREIMLASYIEAEKINELKSQLVVPAYGFGYASHRRYYDFDYDITVYFKQGTNPYLNHNQQYYYQIPSGSMPDFVRADLRLVGRQD